MVYLNPTEIFLVQVPEVPEAERQPGMRPGPNAFYEYMKPKMAQVGMMHSFG